MNVLFRVDASKQIGTGHVMRCLTLARKLREMGHHCKFACRVKPGHLIGHIESQGFDVIKLGDSHNEFQSSVQNESESAATWLGVSQKADAHELRDSINPSLYDWVVVDHYGIDAEWEKDIRSVCRRILVIDDLANRHHDCDALLDQNLVEDYFHRYDGLIPDACARLLGPKYALLHADFESFDKHLVRTTSEIPRILVFFGGTDVGGVTAFVVDSLLQINDLSFHLDVVLNKDTESYRSLVTKRLHSERLTIHSGLPSLAKLMSECDLAIGATGVTTWERICVGLPTLVMTVAENQEVIAEHLDHIGLVAYVGRYKSVTITDLIVAFRKFIAEGKSYNFESKRRALELESGTKVVAALMGMDSDCKLHVRPARFQDLYQLFEWANDPMVRENSLNTVRISLESHQAWFQAKLDSDDTRIYIVSDVSGVRVGVVRFERSENTWNLNYSISPILRGKGMATNMLASAIHYHTNEVGSHEVTATVKRTNIASHRVLEKVSFVLVDKCEDVSNYLLSVKQV